jgi:predicted nucleotidyltransferase
MREEELHIIYETLHGSHAYGLNTPESDNDYKGVAIPPKEYFTGYLNRFEQLEQREPDDRVIYDIRKFFKLAANCNPNIIEVLFCDDSEVVTITKEGEELRACRDYFLSKKARYTFLGYAFAQLKRIKSHRAWLLNPPKGKPERTHFGLPERNLISSDQMGAFISLTADLIKGTIEEAKLSAETRAELQKMNPHALLNDMTDVQWKGIQELTGVSDNMIEAAMREKRYRAALQHWESYLNWKKTRNPKRAVLEAKCGFDGKHASHLVRLVRMGREILTEGKVIVKRPDREELIAIKNGEWTFDQVMAEIDGMDKQFDIYYKASILPKTPNHKVLNAACQGIIERYHF